MALVEHNLIDCTPEAERAVDRRLVLSAAIRIDALQTR
jgi:hypothetical protein